MGFFDFLKSKEQREKEALMQSLQNQVFPGGKAQMNQEIQEVRKLLDFRYSLDEVRHTYLHAAAIFFIAKDKSQERITASILYNNDSVVTKADAIRIYNYLVQRNKPKNVFEQASQMVNNLDDGTKLFFTAKGGIVLLKRYRDLSDGGKFEVILCNSIFVLNHYQTHYPSEYQEVEESYFESLFKQASEFHLGFDVKGFSDFIDNRFTFYTDELNNLYSGGNYIPAKMYNAFYEAPLTLEPEVSTDVVEVMTFYPVLTEMVSWVTEKVKKI